MNTTKLHEDCKKEGRKVFEAFKNQLINYPLNNKINNETIETVILFQIRQEFGRKVLKKNITGSETSIQLKEIQKIVNDYKEIIISTCWVWANKNLELN